MKNIDFYEYRDRKYPSFNSEYAVVKEGETFLVRMYGEYEENFVYDLVFEGEFDSILNFLADNSLDDFIVINDRGNLYSPSAFKKEVLV